MFICSFFVFLSALPFIIATWFILYETIFNVVRKITNRLSAFQFIICSSLCFFAEVCTVYDFNFQNVCCKCNFICIYLKDNIFYPYNLCWDQNNKRLIYKTWINFNILTSSQTNNEIHAINSQIIENEISEKILIM